MRIPKLEAKKVANGGIKPEFIGGYDSFRLPESRDFIILQLTDMHFGRGFLSVKQDKLARNAVITLVERVKPDLIIITGDNVLPIPIFSGTANNMRASEYVGRLMEAFEIPWTMVFGNHDAECFATHSKEALFEYYSSLPHCLLKDGAGKTVSGAGNHIINLSGGDGAVRLALVMLDSNMYLKKSFFSTFDNVHPDQTEWYKREILKIGKGKTVPSLAFMHMPPAEYREAWAKLKTGHTDEVEYHSGTIAEVNDHVGFSYKKKGTFFEEMLSFGSCKGIFCGHDHLNNISMTYKGIRLTYGMAIDFLAYRGIMKKYTNRGGTVIKIDKNAEFDVFLEPLTSPVEIFGEPLRE